MDPVAKFIIVPLIALVGIYVVGSAAYALFGVPALALFAAVGGVAFLAKFYKRS